MPERMGSGRDSINQSINQSINRNYLPFHIWIFAAMSSTAYLSWHIQDMSFEITAMEALKRAKARPSL